MNIGDHGRPGPGEHARRMAIAMVAAHAMGGLVVFVLLGFVMPVPEEVQDDYGLTLLNGVVFAGYLAVVVPIEVVLGRRLGERLLAGLARGRLDERERELALRFPLRLFALFAAPWAIAVLLFFAVNVGRSTLLGFEVAITVGLGGATTCAIAYLLAERIQRPITALALAGEVPEHTTVPGVGARALLAWALGTAIPVLGMGVAAVVALIEDVSVERLAATAIFLGATALLVGAAAMLAMSRSIAEPLEALRGAVARVEAGTLDVAVSVDDASEVGFLQAGFNRMAAGLRERERLRDLFGRHVGEDVAREALERRGELASEVREVAVLFVDIVRSTTLAAGRSAAEVVELLNRFFDVVVQVVAEHGGFINKFQGDAALAIFGAPVPLEDRDGRALAAARALAERLRREVPELEAGIGVSGGPAVAGNVGAVRRFEYTVIGDPVNEAARLTELAKAVPERVMANAALLKRASEAEADRWEAGETVTLRGLVEGTRVATPRSAKADSSRPGVPPSGPVSR
jgi:adenylate cyclase